MKFPRFLPAKDADALTKRVNRYFNDISSSRNTRSISEQSQIAIGNLSKYDPAHAYQQINIFGENPSKNIVETIDFIASLIPSGNIYLFGGILRDLALFGKKGFVSDVDLVVEGDWETVSNYIESLGAHKNKFGGYRFKVGNSDVDIWNATETWAIKNKHAQYCDISSLLNTTVLNWDAILMNWKSRRLIHSPSYFKDINERVIDIVLENNPNPLGMVVRVLRYILQKDAQYISFEVIHYLHKATQKYGLSVINRYERKGYQNCIIDKYTFDKFKNEDFKIKHFNNPDRILDSRIFIGDNISSRQLEQELFIPEIAL